MAEMIRALLEFADAKVQLRAVTPPVPRWQRWLIRAWWLLRGSGAERDLALRWRKPRYRLMVTGPEGETSDWARQINGKFIPICTRREGMRRKAAFLLTHPDCTARLERIRGGADAG